MPLFTRRLKSEPVIVESNQDLVSISVSETNIKATYHNLRVHPDGRAVVLETFSIDRDPRDLGPDVAAWLAQAAQFAETWRIEDADRLATAQAKRDAEAARWAALTDEEKKAEVAAARAEMQAAVDAQIPSDPRG